MNFEHVLYEKADRIARITINRPQVRNALNAQSHLELRTAFEDFRDDPKLWVAIVTGSGDQAFCAGADLKEASVRFADAAMGERPLAPSSPTAWGAITRDFECFKPIIAAVNGFALGGGAELALACDLIVAADTAQFGFPEVRRGMLASAGGLVRLPRQIPQKQAMALLLTGRPVTAAQALQLGLVNEVVTLSELPAAADGWARAILECSPTSVQLSKQIAVSFLHLPVDDALAAQQPIQAQLAHSADAIEGPTAFAEKRSPVWSNTVRRR